MRRHLACSLAAWLVVAVAAGWAAGQEVFDEPTRAFAAQLDLSAVEQLGVQDAGRVKILDTFAREQLDAMLGEVPGGVRPTFAYLELLLRPQAYLDVPLLEVKGDALRDRLAAHLPAEDAERLRDTRRLPPRALLDERGADALRLEIRGPAPEAGPATGAGEHVQSILASAEAADPALRRARERLLNGYFAFLGWPPLRVVPPPGEGEWLSVDQLAHLAEPPEAHAGHAHAPPAPEVRERAAEMQSLLTELGRAWRARDAQRTNAALGRLAARLHELSPSQQPSPARAWAELAYNRLYRFTIAWVGYAGAFVVLLAAVVRPRRRWRVAGLALLALSTAVLAAGMDIRWWLSGRPWYLPPVTGQFESVVSAALLGACVALVLERIRPRNTFALAGAFFALIALLLAFLLPDHMRAEIRPPQGILNNWILPLHVGTIILGYAMIAIGLVLSVVYLLTLARGRARAAGPWSAGPDLSAASPPGALADVDRCNLIVAQLACWMVGVGTILGAWWADYSWGRWWGWDPKEVWALITWIVYLAILHVRYVVPARTRGLWTAGLTVAGAAVMLFNWVVVKYILPSLHGYA